MLAVKPHEFANFGAFIMEHPDVGQSLEALAKALDTECESGKLAPEYKILLDSAADMIRQTSANAVVFGIRGRYTVNPDASTLSKAFVNDKDRDVLGFFNHLCAASRYCDEAQRKEIFTYNLDKALRLIRWPEGAVQLSTIGTNQDHFDKLYNVLKVKLSHLRQAQRQPPDAVIPAYQLFKTLSI
jgi:hypothetical protein